MATRLSRRTTLSLLAAAGAASATLVWRSSPEALVEKIITSVSRRAGQRERYRGANA
jgi:hypothetical protein